MTPSWPPVLSTPTRHGPLSPIIIKQNKLTERAGGVEDGRKQASYICGGRKMAVLFPLWGKHTVVYSRPQLLCNIKCLGTRVKSHSFFTETFCKTVTDYDYN